MSRELSIYEFLGGTYTEMDKNCEWMWICT